ncbi:hypothetical protein RSSM_03476 [Rhodopirellula sallentina SM41]|uniref:Uncharacterized protein n=1 Tax=Rhodopirellula sallentina SM41 TaxID=1263870 RepID=M5U125_9BACT|nr:hypothetical protein RSSM_03476 [Rhodopirellula sallentina SM41]
MGCHSVSWHFDPITPSGSADWRHCPWQGSLNRMACRIANVQQA